MAMLGFEINKRQPLAEGRSFGATGAHEQIDGIAHFAIDPAHPSSRRQNHRRGSGGLPNLSDTPKVGVR